MSGYRFTEHDARTFTDHEIAQGVALDALLDAEIWPDDPALPLRSVIARRRAKPARIRAWEVRAWAPDGALAGHASSEIDPEHDDNPDLLEVEVFVDPAHRRNGVGTHLLERLTQFARGEGRTRMTSWTTSRATAGDAFAHAAGACEVTHQHINHLPVAAVDRVEMERWARDGPVRAAGYDLIGWDGPTPDEHLAAFADLYHVMNDAPLDALETNDTTFTPERLREWETAAIAGGSEAWTLVARAPDGSFAGLHNVTWKAVRPALVNVEDTGVRPEHRGHALGKWLKATMTLRILDERPAVVEIRTGNADSNDAMLGINRAMGYVPMMASTTWELGIEH